MQPPTPLGCNLLNIIAIACPLQLLIPDFRFPIADLKLIAHGLSAGNKKSGIMNLH
jgi:hypothetical protein